MLYDWHKMNIDVIVGGVAPDGASYLKSFLLDYKQEFNVEIVNPNCRKCLRDYQSKFIKKYGNMENTSKYRLHKKREGLQLEFGSSIFVNNKNITDEYAEKLIKRFKKAKENFKLSDLFDIYPNEVIEVKEVEEVKEEIQEIVKKPRKKRK